MHPTLTHAHDKSTIGTIHEDLDSFALGPQELDLSETHVKWGRLDRSVVVAYCDYVQSPAQRGLVDIERRAEEGADSGEDPRHGRQKSVAVDLSGSVQGSTRGNAISSGCRFPPRELGREDIANQLRKLAPPDCCEGSASFRDVEMPRSWIRNKQPVNPRLRQTSKPAEPSAPQPPDCLSMGRAGW